MNNRSGKVAEPDHRDHHPADPGFRCAGSSPTEVRKAQPTPGRAKWLLIAIVAITMLVVAITPPGHPPATETNLTYKQSSSTTTQNTAEKSCCRSLRHPRDPPANGANATGLVTFTPRTPNRPPSAVGQGGRDHHPSA